MLLFLCDDFDWVTDLGLRTRSLTVDQIILRGEVACLTCGVVREQEAGSWQLNWKGGDEIPSIASKHTEQ